MFEVRGGTGKALPALGALDNYMHLERLMMAYHGEHRAEDRGDGKHGSNETSDSAKSGHGGKHDAVPATDRGRTDAATLLGRRKSS